MGGGVRGRRPRTGAWLSREEDVSNPISSESLTQPKASPTEIRTRVFNKPCCNFCDLFNAFGTKEINVRK